MIVDDNELTKRNKERGGNTVKVSMPKEMVLTGTIVNAQIIDIETTTDAANCDFNLDIVQGMKVFELKFPL